LEYRVLHIGKNNVFGQYSQFLGHKVINHNDFMSCCLKSLSGFYDMIIISAFDPSNKIGINNDELIERILKLHTSEVIVYISTCRITNHANRDVRNEHYTNSKKRQEEFLLSQIPNSVTIKRFPVIIPKFNSKTVNGFLGQVSRSMRHHKELRFDVSQESTWNFLSIDDAFSRLLIANCSENVVGSHQIRIGDLCAAIIDQYPAIKAVFGEKLVHYSVENELPNYLINQKSQTNVIRGIIDVL
jgi:hypothetical protein